MTTDVHNLGNFASLAAAWERYPNGAMAGDYIFIAGVRYDWDKYEKQWLTPVAVTDMNISVFDVSTYDFEANDWRHALLNGEYTVVSNTQAVGKLLKYDDGFVLEGFVTLTEAGADKVFSPVVDGGKPKADAKILSGNQSYHKYVYVDSKGVYNVSDATERGQIDDIQHHLDDLQQYVDDNLNSLNKAVSAIKKDVGTAEDVAAADGTLYARISKNADDVDELRDAVGHIDSAQTATDKTVTQHTADISTLQTAVETKANLVDGKVSSEELPIVTSLKQDDYTTIPSAKLVDEALTAVGNTLEEKINNKVVGLLHWQGVKSTTSEIKSITSAKKGDVWHSNGDGSEWVCTQDITAANADAWTELGTPIDLSGYYTKTEVDKKVKPLADSIGTDNDAASANGSLYARIKKNATDINDYASKMSSGTLRDLYISAGAKYNEQTGFYELNGLTDITEEEMRVIWQEDLSGWYLKGRTNLTRNISTRGNAGGYNGGIDITNICANNNNITIFNFGSSLFAHYLDNAFSECTKLETIDTRFQITPFGGVVGPNIFRGCIALKEVRFNMRYLERSTNVNFPASPLISKTSILSVIQTTPTTGSVKPLVVVGLNESAYNRLKDDTDITAALTEKNGFVTLTQI